MGKKIQVFIAALVAVGVFSLAVPDALAAGSFYVHSANGNNGNSCKTTAKPCKTIQGALNKIKDLNDPSNSTMYLKGTFNEDLVIDGDAGANLTGLRLTAWDANNKPLLDGTGRYAALTARYIDGLKIDRIKIANSVVGLYLYGSSSKLMDGAEIKYNTIYDLTNTSGSVIGIQAYNIKNGLFRENTIKDNVLNLTDKSGSDSMYGMYLTYVYDTTVRKNTISKIKAINTAQATANSHTSSVYGIYVNDSKSMAIRGNTLQGLRSLETSSLNNTHQYANTYGIYANNSVDLKIRGNEVDPLSAKVDLTSSTSTGQSYLAGIYIYDAVENEDGENYVYNNNVRNLTSSCKGSDCTGISTGMKISYASNLKVYENRIKSLYTITKSEASTLYSYVYGVDGPYLSSNVMLIDNTIGGLDSVSSYSGDYTSSEQKIYGINAWGSPGTKIRKNTFQNFNSKTNNSDADHYSDAGTIYGVLIEDSHNSDVKSNAVNGFDCLYVDSGHNGYAKCTQYGISAKEADNLLIEKNTLHSLDMTLNTTDSSESSTMSGVWYGLRLADLSNATVKNNTVRSSVNKLTGAGTNYGGLYTYGLYVEDVVHSTINKNKAYGIESSAGSQGYLETYGMYLNDSHGTTIRGNQLRGIKSAMTGSSGDNYCTGMYVSSSYPLFINSNVIRNFTCTSNGDLYMYGILFRDDASGVRAFNNVVMSESKSSADEHVGVKFQGKGTADAHLINNTIAKWRYPLYIQGGKEYRLRNNILHAAGTGAYALVIGMNNVDANTLYFNYNLYYNSKSSSKERLVYDIDNAEKIHFGDWKNKNGTYGYDTKSINKRTYLTSKGRLKAKSYAIDAGSSTNPYSPSSTAGKMLKTDIDGQSRPAKSGTPVDIGADEYKK
ncbi:MAG: right-handed parallel beta-helix repeat-containing protein [Candidatus Kerfeldbacteria bacterium]